MNFENFLRTLWISCGYLLVSLGVLSLICKLII